MVDVIFVKASRAGEPDRTYLVDGDVSRRVAVHVMHDLPHLVVESLFGIDDGLWGELIAGRHADADRASTARDAKRQKQGRIVIGAASDGLTPAHARAKTLTNYVANTVERPSVEDVRSGLASVGDPSIDALMARVDDGTIARAIRASATLRRRWLELPPGEALRLSWPLASDFEG